MDGFPGSGGGGEGSRNDRGRTVGRDGDGLLPSVADFGAELDATTAFAQAMCEPPPTSRVGQLDALDMESEINEELLQAVARIAQPIAPALLQRFRPELELVLRALFFRYTIYHNKPSVGCQLQGLVYANGSATAAADAAAEAALAAAKVIIGSSAPDSPSVADGIALKEDVGVGTLTKKQKVAYFLLAICTPWAVARFKDFALRREWNLADPDSWQARIWRVFERVESWWRLVSLLHFVVFLYRGSYRSIVDRFLRMRLVHAQTLAAAASGAGIDAAGQQRLLDFEVINQDLIWATLGHFWVVGRHFVPWSVMSWMVGTIGKSVRTAFDVLLRWPALAIAAYFPSAVGNAIRQRLGVVAGVATAGSTTTTRAAQTAQSLRVELSRPCKLCGDPLVMPYVVDGCGHCFCYVCLSTACTTAEPAPLPCPRCGRLVEGSRRVGATHLVKEPTTGGGGGGGGSGGGSRTTASA